MFKKPFKVTGSNLVKRSVKRNLINQLKKEFTNLSDEEWQQLIPPKQDLTTSKISGTHTIIYSVENTPYFFDVDGRNDFYPSVFVLWKFPKLMNTVVVQPNIFNFLLRGADLFLPGVLVPVQGLKWVVGSKLSVTLLLYGLPIAVGKCLIDNKHVQQQGMKGKGVKILHTYKDHLWELAGANKCHPQEQVGWKMDHQWEGFEDHYSEFQSFDIEKAGEEGLGEEKKEGKEEEKEEETENKGEEGEKEEEEEEEELESEFLRTIGVKLRSPRICPEVVVPDERVSSSAAVSSVASCFPLSSRAGA
mmetsp:Transcript_43304/g.60783  ORF Transcript_43304/g.60783 Transcript_43304/m.60783 type:complete len:304 (-) Transcript_43304:72-983(-)